MASFLAVLLLVFSPPVPGPVVAGFQPPSTRYGPGHVGLDYAVVPGEPVHVVGDGTVVFAGRVGATLHVSVRHADGTVTTVSFLRTISVSKGDTVRRGDIVGTAGAADPLDAHYDGTRLLLTARVGGHYVDPASLFGPPDLASVVHLVPWDDRGAASTRGGGTAVPRPGPPPLALDALAATVLRTG